MISRLPLLVVAVTVTCRSWTQIAENTARGHGDDRILMLYSGVGQLSLCRLKRRANWDWAHTCSSALSQKRNTLSVTSKSGNMILDPEQCQSLVVQAVVRLITSCFHLRRRKESGGADAVTASGKVMRGGQDKNPRKCYLTHLMLTEIIGMPISILATVIRARSFCGYELLPMMKPPPWTNTSTGSNFPFIPAAIELVIFRVKHSVSDIGIGEKGSECCKRSCSISHALGGFNAVGLSTNSRQLLFRTTLIAAGLLPGLEEKMAMYPNLVASNMASPVARPSLGYRTMSARENRSFRVAYCRPRKRRVICETSIPRTLPIVGWVITNVASFDAIA